MSPSFRAIAASALALLPLAARAGFSASSQNNLAIYWGQGSGQKTLASYCDDSSINIIPVAFEISLLNPANGLDTGNEDVASVGEDIKTCQAAGKTILLSIGGATFTENGLTSTDIAKSAAQKMWSLFGPTSSSTAASSRPFGDAVVDGFDLDLETVGLTNIDVFVGELRALMDADSSKSWMLTAAPQCVYPDQADKSFLQGQVAMDAVFVQFYNNPNCGVNNFVSASDIGEFNLATWDNWAKTVSKNPNVKIFIGIPGSSAAAGSGYVDAATMAAIIGYAQSFDSFGGIMSWDMVRIVENTGYLSTISKALAAGAVGGGSDSGAGTTKVSSVLSSVTSATSATSIATQASVTGTAQQSSAQALTTSSTTSQTSTIATQTTFHIVTRTTQRSASSQTAPGGVFVGASSTTVATLPTTTAISTTTTVSTTGTSTLSSATTTQTATSSEQGQQTPGTACTTEGAWICVDGSAFQQCGSGTWSVVMLLAEGTRCTAAGTGSGIDIAAIEGNGQKRRALGRHLHWHRRSHF